MPSSIGQESTVPFLAKYDSWRTRLLDLAGRNPLLRFRPTKVSTVQITLPAGSGLYERLVLDERPLSFPYFEGTVRLTDIERAEDPTAPEVRHRVRPGDIETTKLPPDLERSLYTLAHAARLSREERGVNTLHVALGMLAWRPIDGADEARAPLVLVPVDLTRDSHLTPYKLAPFDEDAEANPTLLHMLQTDFGLALPSFDAEPTLDSLERFFAQVATAVAPKRWRVLPEAWLGQFHFRKLAMYKDLETHREAAAIHTRVLAIAGAGQFNDPPALGPIEESDEIRPTDVFTALDADSSQLEALLRARQAQDLIVQGPPGTGKSQTIANLIVQFLLDGKRVLFVSEKMAALSVVYRRLQEIGLGRLCLEIHSDKSNKRDVLQRIQRASQADRTRLPDYDPGDFDRLLQRRRTLNEYVRTLHEPLVAGKSAYQIQGELARLESAPTVRAPLEVAVDQLDLDRVLLLEDRVRRLAQMPQVIQAFKDHPWRSIALAEWSMQLQDDLCDELRRFRAAVDATQSICAELAEAMRTPAPRGLHELADFASLAYQFAESPGPPRPWLDAAPLAELDREALRRAQRQTEWRTTRQSLLGLYGEELFDLNLAAIGNALDLSEGRALAAVRGDAAKRDTLAGALPSLEAALTVATTAVDVLTRGGTELAALLERQAPGTLADAEALADVGVKATEDLRPLIAWFNLEALEALRMVVTKGAKRARRRETLKAQLGRQFTDRLWVLPLRAWRDEASTRWRGPFRVFKSDYRRAMRQLCDVMASPTKMNHTGAMQFISRGAEVQDLDTWMHSHHAQFEASLGAHFTAETTDWPALCDRLDRFQALVSNFPGSRVPEGVQRILIADGPALRRIGSLGQDIATAASQLKRSLGEIGQTLAWDRLPGLERGVCSPLPVVRETLGGLIGQLRRFAAALQSLDSPARVGVERLPEEKAVDAHAAAMVAQYEAEIASASAELTTRYGDLFQGRETDWTVAREAVNWAESFRARCRTARDGPALADSACSRDRVQKVKSSLGALADGVAGIHQGRLNLDRSFNVDSIAVDGAPVGRAALPALSGWLSDRIERMSELHDWLRFCDLRKDCDVAGLGPFVGAALEHGIPATQLEQALRKRVLATQLDAIHAARPVLRTFAGRDHEDLVRQFRDLDRNLMRAHARRAQEAVIRQQPNMNGPGVGQLGFLRKELYKQKRHAPLRKLFQESGTVIQGLTPCLLMSPLSVATFLPQDSVNFDVVIFDEASQMPVEESIGAILRGNQLIVAGDPKQLPPTRFFERFLDDESAEYDETQPEAPMESILEECQGAGMQLCRLEWHYRSRHESLITFSNAEFYENGLVTFPAPEHGGDGQVGVRFEHVPDGIYDRGHSRTNRREAERVAVLVERHLERWHEKRSLGVIALSAAQEAAIAEEVEKLIRRRPELEPLLSPVRHEPFFIKALENVQGDERDTILISIGYGRDAAGNFSLNFGPINTQGGERRLNVAVTRARWELALIASITADDIDLSRTNSAGARLVRKYLQFARGGALPPESVAGGGEPGSPFEVAVWEALRERGLEVDRQVGASRYRIDLGIKDPDQPGRYLLGVECDGAMYHSGRVARDRDRLREQVLVSLGWKIHRVWSTDWVRDPKGCAEKVMRRVAMERQERATPQAIDGSYPTSELRSDPPAAQVAPIGRSADLAPELKTLPNHSGGPNESTGDPYRALVGAHSETPLTRRSRESFYSGDSARLRADICDVVEHEGPVHMGEVILRIARAYGLQRVGSTVEKIVGKQILALQGAERIRRSGKFLWPTGRQDVLPRRPVGSGETRSIETVPPEEIDAAILIVVRLAAGVREEELAAEVARVFGYQRTGGNISRVVHARLQHTLKTGQVVTRGEFLVVPDDPDLRGPQTGVPSGPRGAA